MIYKEIINNKLIIFEIINSGNLILKRKRIFLNQIFKNKDKNEVMRKLKHNLINSFIQVKVVKEAKTIFLYEELHTTNNTDEILEIILIMLENSQQFEACKLVLKILNKI